MSRIVFILLALMAAASAHAQRVLTGTTPGGAYYRISVPDNWKAGDPLILFQHGLTFEPPGPNPDLGPLESLQLKEGYAIAASSYRQRSWALFTAPDDNAELLAVFRQQVGNPGSIIPYGASLGGLVALKLAEDSRFAPVPGVYSACPPAAGSRVWDTAIDLRLAYDVVCSGAGDLPTGDEPYPWAYNLSDIPDNLSDLQDEALLLETLLPLNQCTGVNLPSSLRNDAMQRRLDQLKNLAHITDDHWFVVNAGYATYALSDLLRAPDKMNGQNPFSNIGVDYNDATLNANIRRIQADPFAQLYFRWASDFRGRIAPQTKIISIQTSKDQLVIPANQSVLRATVPASQLTSALVNESSPSHCGFSLAEGVAGWEALRAWIASNHQPQVSDLENGCNAAIAQGASGPCRYDPSVVPPSFDSQVRPRPADASASLVLDGGFSGQWYDPARTGEGIDLEILPGNKALLYFFTYPPPGASGAQAWLTAVGDVVGNGIEFADVQLPALDANGQLQGTHWGRIGLTFSDCNTGAMRWDGPADWGSLEVPLVHLTALQGIACGSNASVAQPSGAWYDPAHNGAGFVFEKLSGPQIATIWFGFDANGAPVWETGVLGTVDSSAYSGTLAQGVGPNFGTSYDAGKFQLVPQGNLVTLLQCATGTAQFTAAAGQPGYLAPSQTLQRITTPLGVAACAQ